MVALNTMLTLEFGVWMGKKRWIQKLGKKSWAHQPPLRNLRFAQTQAWICSFSLYCCTFFFFPGIQQSDPENHTHTYISFSDYFPLQVIQFSSVTQSCSTLCNPMNHSMPGFPVHHQLPEFAQTHIHRVSDAIQPCHPLSSPSPPAPNLSQHQSVF